MTKRRNRRGNGQIVQRGEDTFRLRYTIGGKRFSQTVTGSKADARIELRRLTRSADDGSHVEPSKMMVAEFVRSRVDQWDANTSLLYRSRAPWLLPEPELCPLRAGDSAGGRDQLLLVRAKLAAQQLPKPGHIRFSNGGDAPPWSNRVESAAIAILETKTCA